MNKFGCNTQKFKVASTPEEAAGAAKSLGSFARLFLCNMY